MIFAKVSGVGAPFLHSCFGTCIFTFLAQTRPVPIVASAAGGLGGRLASLAGSLRSPAPPAPRRLRRRIIVHYVYPGAEGRKAGITSTAPFFAEATWRLPCFCFAYFPFPL